MDLPNQKTRREKVRQVRNSAVKFVILSAGLACLLVTILYVVMITAKTNYVSAKPIGNIDEHSKAEKIIYSESRKSNRIKKAPPHPFANVYHGPTPAQFTPTTIKTTTPKYPQLNEYRKKIYPKSIQDIISFMTLEKHNKRSPTHSSASNTRYSEGYREQQGQIFTENRHNSSSHLSLNNGDPFHSYKPHDPSDINLLAIGDLRFAPPIWKTFKRNPKNSHPQEENSDKQEIYNNGKPQKKPIVISLNIYPVDNEVSRTNNRYTQKLVPYRIQAFVPRTKDETKQETMIIHFNVFPNDMIVSDDAQESRLRGNFVGYIREGN